MTAHRPPCTDGDMCGEPAHCPPTGRDTAHAREVAELRAEVERLRTRIAGWANDYEQRAATVYAGTNAGDIYAVIAWNLRAILADPAADDDTEGTS